MSGFTFSYTKCYGPINQGTSKVSEKAVVLLSGGIDSTTTLAIARNEGFHLYALSFQYGQRNHFELRAAKKLAHLNNVKEHLILNIDLSAVGGSAMTSDRPVPKNRSQEDMVQTIPVTYVPARNIIFLSFGLSWAESVGSSDIFIGVNSVDYSGYPDCRPQFIDAFQNMANLGTKAGVQDLPFKIHTPLIHMTKAQIIMKGMALGVHFNITQSCYDPDDTGRACGRCDSCLLRKKGFLEAGMNDPTNYVGI